MSSPDKLTGEKVTNAVDTDDFGGSSARLDDPGGGIVLSSSSVESTGDVMDNMGKDNLGGGNSNDLDSCSNFDTFNNHKAFSDTLSRMSLLI